LLRLTDLVIGQRGNDKCCSAAKPVTGHIGRERHDPVRRHRYGHPISAVAANVDDRAESIPASVPAIPNARTANTLCVSQRQQEDPGTGTSQHMTAWIIKRSGTPRPRGGDYRPTGQIPGESKRSSR
jgi:hypothetical protein